MKSITLILIAPFIPILFAVAALIVGIGLIGEILKDVLGLECTLYQ